MLLREKVGLRPRTQKRYPLLKGYKRWLLREMVGPLAVDLWWFPLGCFRFLEPLAPSNQQQHGSQRLRFAATEFAHEPPSVSWEFASREFQDGRGRGTAESCMVAEIVVYWRGNPTNSLRQRRGVPCVPHPGANPQPGVISGAAEK